MKKYLALASALVLAAALLTACGSPKEEAAGSSAPAAAADTADAAASDTAEDADTAGTADTTGAAASGDFDPAAVKTFGDIFSVIDDENSQTGYTEHTFVYAFPVGDDYYRAETTLSEEASAALWDLEFDDPERDAKTREIISPLEVTSFTNLTEGAPDQAFLDSLIGKTGGELFEDGWTYNYYNLADMEAGLDHEVYSFTVTFNYDGPQMENTDDFDFYEEFKDLTIKTATYDGIGNASYIPDVEG